jgi:acyl-CoA synthetase (AMP-forming)/AMP-acid ligase II
LAAPLVRELREALPHTRIFINYGQTEGTARLASLPTELVEAKPSSIGKEIPGVKLEVLNASGAGVRPGEVGEIVATGDNVALGYWRERLDTERTFRGGRLYTGDLATVDEEGFIYIADRANDFLKCGGERVSCRYLEEQLMAFEELSEVAVIGMPDDVLGEAARAFVVPRSKDYPDLVRRLTQFCMGRIPPQFIPKQIVVVPELPKNSSGKIDKSELKSTWRAHPHPDQASARRLFERA